MQPRRDRLDRAVTRLGFSLQFVYTALAVATGVVVVFVAGAGWNAVRWMRRRVGRRPRS
jgi:hypothetical protein